MCFTTVKNFKKISSVIKMNGILELKEHRILANSPLYTVYEEIAEITNKRGPVIKQQQI